MIKYGENISNLRLIASSNEKVIINLKKKKLKEGTSKDDYIYIIGHKFALCYKASKQLSH